MPKRKAETTHDHSDENEEIPTVKKAVSGDENSKVACEVSFFLKLSCESPVSSRCDFKIAVTFCTDTLGSLHASVKAIQSSYISFSGFTNGAVFCQAFKSPGFTTRRLHTDM